MAVVKWAKSIVGSPKKQLRTLLPELRQLRDDLKRSGDSRDPLTEIVNFFNYVSRWHDRGLNDIIAAFEEVNYGQFEELINQLKVLNLHFHNAGRDGWNRTEKGETVTADKVYLGNIWGLFTHPVSFWKQGQNEKKGGWGFSNMEHLNPYDVVSSQAASFMKSHIEPMIKIIDRLEQLAR